MVFVNLKVVRIFGRKSLLWETTHEDCLGQLQKTVTLQPLRPARQWAAQNWIQIKALVYVRADTNHGYVSSGPHSELLNLTFGALSGRVRKGQIWHTCYRRCEEGWRPEMSGWIREALTIHHSHYEMCWLNSIDATSLSVHVAISTQQLSRKTRSEGSVIISLTVFFWLQQGQQFDWQLILAHMKLLCPP